MKTIATSDFTPFEGQTSLPATLTIKIVSKSSILSHHRSLDAFFDIVACRKIVARAQLWFSVRKVQVVKNPNRNMCAC